MRQVPNSQVPGPAARALNNQTCFPNSTRTSVCTATIADAYGSLNGQPAGHWTIYTNFAMSTSVTSLRGTIYMKSFVEEVQPGPHGGLFKVTALQSDTLNGIADGTTREIHSHVLQNSGGAETGTAPDYNPDQFEIYTPLFRSANAWAQARFYLRAEWYIAPPGADQIPGYYQVLTDVRFRCDNATATGSSGCVNPDYLPVVNFPQAVFPTIQPNIVAGMDHYNNIGYFGSGAPLHRASGRESANRNLSCSNNCACERRTWAATRRYELRRISIRNNNGRGREHNNGVGAGDREFVPGREDQRLLQEESDS